MKKRLDCKQMTKEFNELRQNNIGKTFTGAELDQLLLKYGFNNHVIAALKKKLAFDSYRVGSGKLFSFREEPFHFSKMQEVLNYYDEHKYSPKKKQELKSKKEPTEEEKAISLLRSQGYEMRRCVGLDLDRFREENPDLYKKYLVYETVC